MFSTRKRPFQIAAGVAVALSLLAANGVTDVGASSTAHEEMPSNDPVIALRSTMRELWADHMQWTWSTVVAFFTNPDGLQPQLDRLLANQQDIGNAVGSFYGDEAGAHLAELLTTHITDAVPVLEAAKAGDDAAVQTALDEWYRNAEEIADFLSAANPEYWPAEATRPMLRQHIDQTTAYATDILTGDYAAAVAKYDEAFDHMMMLADTLTDGIVATFPERFAV